MGENSKIEWCDHTFNPFIGCTRVSRGCENCYAETLMDKRYGRVQWGPKGVRQLTSDQNWREPIRWNAAARKQGIRRRVFCASLADVFDDHPSILPEWRARLWDLIAKTPNLDWLLLTKRPENWPLMLPVSEPAKPFLNVRLGVTIEDQDAFNRRGPILKVAAHFGWPTFVSYEPALGPVDWEPLLATKAIGWMICGGESGPGARPMHPAWARSLRDQCAGAGVPFFMKQMTKKGPIPDDLLIRDFPRDLEAAGL